LEATGSGTGAGAHRADIEPRTSLTARSRPEISVRTIVEVAGPSEIEDHGSRHDGNDPIVPITHLESSTLLDQELHDSCDGIESESTSTGQADRVDVRNESVRSEKIRLASTRGRTTNRDASTCAGR
jgi:hypothetical protein